MARAKRAANLDEVLDEVTPAPAVRVKPKQPEAASNDQAEKTALVGAHLPARYGKAMKRLAVDEEKTQRDLFIEALDMLFVRYGVKP